MVNQQAGQPLLRSHHRLLIGELAKEGIASPVGRRAIILLSYDAGLSTREVAQAAGISRGRVRYWRRKFRQLGMQVFPGVDETVPSREPVEQAINEASPHHEQTPVDYGPGLASSLFEQTRPVHGLAGDHLKVLEAAVAVLSAAPETETLDPDAPRRNGGALDLHIPEEFSATERRMLKASLLYHRGKVKDEELIELQLTDQQQREARTLAALLRLAAGLKASQSLETEIETFYQEPDALHISLRGPSAKEDGRRVRRKARLWNKLYSQKLRVLTQEELPTPEAVIAVSPSKDLEVLEPLAALPKPGIEPWDTIAVAAKKTLLYHFSVMLENEPGTRLGEDIEALHDMRVATRRMRAAFDVFNAALNQAVVKSHLKGLRATGRALGRVRDLDVFMEKAGKYLETLPQDNRHDLDPLLNGWNNERQLARKAMLDYLDSNSFLIFKRQFNLFLRTPGLGEANLDQPGPIPYLVREVAPQLLYTRLASVRSYEPLLSTASLDQLHALRIELKKLRYTAEFFREVLGTEISKVIWDIKKIQDHLGNLNDARVACQILGEFLEHWEQGQSNLRLAERQNSEPLVAYLAAKHAERHRLLVTFPQTWSTFNRQELRQNLAMAVSVL